MDSGDEKTIDNPSFKVTDRQLPIANVSKIMKEIIPDAAKISRESKEMMGKYATEFIAFVTCRAKDICDCEARKTVTGDDLIRAMEDLDLPYYSEITKMLFEKYKEYIGEPRMTRYQSETIDFTQFHNSM